MNALSAYRFGLVEVRPDERTLTVAGVPAAVGARAFDLLVALIERRERVATKDELLDAVWPGLVVEESNLTVQISALRKILGTQVIATIPGRGYRFVATLGDAALPAPGRPPVLRRLATVVAMETMVLDAATGACVADADTTSERRDLGADWQLVRDALLLPSAAEAGGRAVELSPESSLIEFTSAVCAARWAAQLQGDLQEQRAAGSTLMTARLGMVVGDVILEEDRLVGDAVALAQAMCAHADWGAVLVSPTVATLAEARGRGIVGRVRRGQCQRPGLARDQDALAARQCERPG
jgi:hypothetical protein